MLIGCLYTVLEMNDNIRTGTSQFQGSRHRSCDVQHLYSTYCIR